MKFCIMHFASSILRFLFHKFYFQNCCMKYYWCYLDAVSWSCREFNSLKKRYTSLLPRTNTFSENRIIRSVVSRKVDYHVLFGARSEKPKVLFGARGEKRTNLFDAKWQLRKILFGSQMVKKLLLPEIIKWSPLSHTSLSWRPSLLKRVDD